MAELLIGPLLRYVGQHEATIWVETDQACTVEVLGRQARTFQFAGHHYALVMVEGLEPGQVLPYEVHLDGQRCWPLPGAAVPPSAIHTIVPDGEVRLLFGSCRAAAPHEEPYTLEPHDHPEGRGIDALRAIGQRMATGEVESWPTMIMMLGDQVYADESSPGAQARMDRTDRHGVPHRVVANFEEYTWLYREAWTPEVERWMLSTVPSAMIFDDHDTIDDWNISQSWVADIRAEPWWSEHIIGGMVSYWIYQHLGNLSPERIRQEGILARLVEVDDATAILRAWALESESFTPVPGGYQFSYDRHLGDVHLVVADCRNGRVLEPGQRRMLDRDEWAWVRGRVLEPARHVVVASSLPVFAPGGLHGIQQWSEATCEGAWTRLMNRPAEALRRALDCEHWAAFDTSFREMEELLIEVSDAGRDRAPESVTVIAGDIHFGFISEITMPQPGGSVVRQAVCSPMRNELARRDRRVMRFGSSRAGRRIGAWLARSVRRARSRLTWEMSSEPVFTNNIGTMTFGPRRADIVIEAVRPGTDGGRTLAVACHSELSGPDHQDGVSR